MGHIRQALPPDMDWPSKLLKNPILVGIASTVIGGLILARLLYIIPGALAWFRDRLSKPAPRYQMFVWLLLGAVLTYVAMRIWSRRAAPAATFAPTPSTPAGMPITELESPTLTSDDKKALKYIASFDGKKVFPETVRDHFGMGDLVVHDLLQRLVDPRYLIVSTYRRGGLR